MSQETPQPESTPKPRIPKPPGIYDAVFTAYHRAREHTVLVFADGTTTHEPVVHISRFMVHFEERGPTNKTDIVGTFIRSRDTLVVGECDVMPIKKTPWHRPFHKPLAKILRHPAEMVGARVRVELACGWVVEGLVSMVRRFALGVQIPGNHAQRAHLLCHAIMGLEVLAPPGADDESKALVAFWNKNQEKRREREAARKAKAQTSEDATHESSDG